MFSLTMITGNATELCGGHSRLNIYQLDGTRPPASETNTTVTPPASSRPSTISASQTTTAVPTPTVKDPVGDWDFEGCYTETTTGRALSGKTFADDDMTLDDCAEFCDEFQLFGVEYGRECYCGNSLREGSVEAEDQDDCQFPCPGDRSTLCGAGMRLQLYRKFGTESPESSNDVSDPGAVSTTSSFSTAPSSTETFASSITESPSYTSISSSAAAPTSAGPTVYSGNRNFTYYSCVAEPSDGKLLPHQIFNNGTHMTPKACVERCWDFNYAGVEYGRECWCGNQLNLVGNVGATPGRNVTDSECDFLCPGNENYFCGAGNRLTLYVRKGLGDEGEV